MKIALLSFYSGQIPRGIETFVHELANRLACQNTVTVFQGGPELAGARYATETIGPNVNWSRINELRHLSTLLFFDFSLKNLARRFYLDYWSRAQAGFALQSLALTDAKTDVVITAGTGWVSLLTRLWCWKHCAKLVIVGQSGPGWDDRTNLLCRPDVFVALTKYQTDWARRNSFGVKITQIPNGVDLERFNPKTQPLKISLPRPIILCVAALEPGKRVDLTVKAVSGLKNASLLVLGSGRLQKDLEAMATSLLPGRFKIVSVPHEKVPAYYVSVDVITVVPPRTESFGIVFLEAMASNKPVVTSDDPARREIVGPAGLFVDPENTEEYSKALKNALEKNWADLPRRQAEKFSWDKIAEQYEKLFKFL